MGIATRPASVPENVYAKLTQDTIDEKLANKLLAACSACSDPEDVQKAFDEFCAGHWLQGKAADVSGMEHIGHVKPDLTFPARLAKSLRMPEALLRTHMYALAGRGTAEELRIARLWWEDTISGQRSVRLSYGPTWFFRSDVDPLTDAPECLPWRLGLYDWYRTSVPSVKCFLFKIRAAELKDPRVPTIFDAGYEYAATVWAPGGLTIPVAGAPGLCAGKNGLREIVVMPHPLADTLSFTLFNSAAEA